MHGYSIAYSDKMVMLHKESPLGRKTKKEKMAMLWINKSKVAWRYLPLCIILRQRYYGQWNILENGI